MAIVGYNFNKISAEKTTLPAGSVKIASNVSVVDVDKTPLKVGSAQNDVLKIKFLFTTEYKENVGKIVIEWDVIFMQTPEIIGAAYDAWKETKKLDEKVALEVYNSILVQCNIKALNLSNDLNLPSPVKFPKVVLQGPEAKKE